MALAEISDEELLARYRTESDSPEQRECLDELFRRHHTKVACWCLRLTGDRESAADLAQEVFLKAFRNLHSFRGSSKFSTWLYSITRNHCWNQLKARASQPELAGDPLLLDILASGGEDAHAVLEREDTRRILRELIQTTLEETERKVLTLHYAEELPIDQVTRLLGLSNASGAKAYIVSAKRKLNRAIERRKVHVPKVAGF